MSDTFEESSISMFRAEAQEGCLLRGTARGAREEASTDIGHSEVLVEVGVEAAGMLVRSLRAEKEGAEEVELVEVLSLKIGKAGFEEEDTVVNVERVDCLITPATDVTRELVQDVRCARDAICFCLGEGFLESTLILKGWF